MFERYKSQQEKSPEQVVVERDERRAQGEGLRHGEREKYNEVVARVVEREVKERQEQREKVQEKIQQRIQQLEELVASRQSQVDRTKKEIADLNEDWSKTDDSQRRESLGMSVRIREQSLPYYQKELDQYSKELEEQKLEMEKTKL